MWQMLAYPKFMISSKILKKLPHRTLISLVRAFAPNIDEEGVCDGFISMWFQAVLSGPQALARFYARLDDIAAHYTTEEQVKALKEEIDEIFRKKTEEAINTRFSKAEKRKIEIRAFAEAITLQQDSDITLDTYINQNDKKILYALTASKKMEEQNLEIFCSPIGNLISTRKELTTYFMKMEAKLCSSEMDMPIGFMLGAFDHATGVYFNQDTKKWHYLDINLLSGKVTYDEVVSPARLAELIFTSFYDRAEYVAFSIMAISTVRFPELIEALREVTNASLLFESRQTSSGITALWLACSQGDKEQVCQLLKHGVLAHINTPNKDGVTPLFIACQNGHTAIVKLLLQNGAGASINLPDKDGATPLCIACQNSHIEVVKLLLQTGAGASINLPSKYGATPLFMACQNGHIEVVKLLLQNGAGASINLPCNGATPLFKASQYGHIEIVALLLQNGAGESINLPVPDTDGLTPLFIACQNGHTEVVKLLLQNGAGASINLPSKYGATPLFMACQNGHTEVAVLLLQNGAEASINLPEKDGLTPLWIACQNGHTAIVKLLLQNGAGASINLPDKDGATPLFIACQNGHIEIVQLLNEYSAKNQVAAEKNAMGKPVRFLDNKKRKAPEHPESDKEENALKVQKPLGEDDRGDYSPKRCRACSIS